MVVAFNIEHIDRAINPFPFMVEVEGERWPLSAIFRNPTFIENVTRELSNRGYNKLDMVKWRINIIIWGGTQHSFRLKGIREWQNVWIS